MQVLEIEVHNRIGQEPSFVDAMRQVLKQHYGEKVIGIGGTFAILQGNAHIHVMVLIELNINFTLCWNHYIKQTRSF